MAERPEPDADELWLSRAAIAKRYGLARSTVSRRTESLKAAGRLRTKLADDGSELIDVASYDAAVAQTIDGVRAGAARARKARTAEAVQKDEPTIFDNMPGQPAGMRFVALDELAPSIGELLDEQAAILDRLRDRAAEIAAAGSPKAVEAKLTGLWREMRDEMLAATEACGLPFVEVVP